MRSHPKYLIAFLTLTLLVVSCAKKGDSSRSKQDYVGHWKLTDTRGNIYFMTLSEDGTCKTTREGGEFGTWAFKENHIEAQWLPKTFRLHYDPGSTQPRLTPSVGPEKSGSSVGTKVEKVPEL